MEKVKTKILRIFFSIQRDLKKKFSIAGILGALISLMLILKQIENDTTLLLASRAFLLTLTILTGLLYVVSLCVTMFYRTAGINLSDLKKISGEVIGTISGLTIVTNGKGIVHLNKPKEVKNRISFAKSEKDGCISGTLNFKLFQGSRWRDSLEAKVSRNTSHILKNDLCICLLKSRLGETCGFLHLIPVTHSTWEEYISGFISDVDFPAENVAPKKSKLLDQKPYGVILFSIGYKSEEAASTANKLQFLFKALSLHLGTISKAMFTEQKYMNILLQPGNGFIEKLCISSGMTKRAILSKDGRAIYTGKIRTK